MVSPRLSCVLTVPGRHHRHTAPGRRGHHHFLIAHYFEKMLCTAFYTEEMPVVGANMELEKSVRYDERAAARTSNPS
jgi:hypothetical protein